MDVSIAVISWNTRALLRRCLESIVDNGRGVEFEVVVVDNNSTDGSPEMVVEDFPWVRLIHNADNRGFAQANNQVIQASSGRYILLLNSDAILVDDTLQRMTAFLDATPSAGVVGGKLLNPDRSFQASYNDFPNLLHEALLLSGLSRVLLPRSFPSYPEELSQSRRSVDWVSGALFMVRRSAVDAVGMLDESYFMYAEEVDWCYRMRRGGWDVFYLPDAVAIHVAGGSSRHSSERKRAQLYRSKWLFLHKHGSPIDAAVFRLLVRVTSYFKLAAWLPTRLSPNPRQREFGHREIASYRVLLAHF